MLRVESTKHESQTTVNIAGRLEGGHLRDLESLCEAAGQEVTLDLSELRTTDEDATRWLASWVRRGKRVLGESPYIRLLLERAQEDPDP